MKIKPLGDRVVIKVCEAVETVKGILLPDMAKKQKEEGIVMAVGDECTVKVGDKVLYKRYGTTEITLDDENYLNLSEKDIMAVLE